ncbi:Adenylate and Guanylate cyclase catalytic domain-containing protein [Brevibacterium siliguriense]|uniref:Adenylate and Guanylate cyclase catalytic domain-containing protein n=1 Tax=Brevibacterium siliguriense TaxID=1136497 RepID=A0A1H1VYC0_9MICO|nr:adenylate/guanylate cyclase domain-containing protein [Brevibacterium siliguriense]SDS89246.1 Adenylate and Guanylate cyclase catalytic domain-containing protein [Brevibacterium siliguriense]
MAVSDFTAGFDIVEPDSLGTPEVGDSEGASRHAQLPGDGSQSDDGSAQTADEPAQTAHESQPAAAPSAEAESQTGSEDPSDSDPSTNIVPEPGGESSSRAEADDRSADRFIDEDVESRTDEPSDEAGGDDEPVGGLTGSAPQAGEVGAELADEVTAGPETSSADTASADAASADAEPGVDVDEDFFSGLREDPRTTALPIIDEDDVEGAFDDDGPDFDDTIYETRTAAERLEEILLDGKRVLDRREAAKLGGISTVSARKMWRALGMSQAKPTDKAYTVSDAHALRIWAKPVADGLIDQTTALSLARAIGQTTDRLVVWQMETLVEFLTEEKGLTDPEARRDALAVVEEMIDPLQKMLTYSWRRNLADVMGRLNVNVSDGLAMDNRQGWYDSSMPLARAVGFIDLVSFTRLSQKMEPRQLADMVQEFQGMAYNIVATGGGRVIKTVGDEVFFAASTPLAGAEIAMTLMERVTAAEDLPQARVGFVWGRVLSRLGDIFGSSVNLAARLTAVADPGTIFTDEETARVLSASDDYVFEPRDSISLHGLGETSIGEMKRGTAAQMRLDLDDETES